MRSNLSDISKVEKFLESIGYPDSYRIAREIVNYISQNSTVSLNTVLEELKEGKPWEYICGSVTFCENVFTVSQDTLIPRIETEQLVYECLEIVKGGDIKNIVDIGTGSGCITISLAYFLQDSSYKIFATDISPSALDIAKVNERKILGKQQIKWINTDLIKDIPTLLLPTLLVANLPYIPTRDYEKLDRSVLEYEPKIALDGGVDGLTYYRKLFEQMKQKDINTNGLYIETESSIFNKTKDLVLKYFPDCKIQEIRDCFQRERFLYISF